MDADILDRPVQVLSQGRRLSDFDFRVTSSVGRELVFLLATPCRHFALLSPHLQQHGISRADPLSKGTRNRRTRFTTPGHCPIRQPGAFMSQSLSFGLMTAALPWPQRVGRHAFRHGCLGGGT